MNFICLLMFMIGCCFASFVNVVIYRLPRKIDFIKGRSFCPHCYHQLSAFDLIPIVSYVLLRGKCRYCHQNISIRDTFVEMIGGLMSIFCWRYYGINLIMIFSLILFLLFITISIIDLDMMIISDELILVCLLMALFSTIILNITFFDRTLGFFIISIPLILINCIVTNSFGGGDIKLISVCGFMIGWKFILVAMYIAILLAGIYSLYLMIFHKANKADHIAFGPYICIGVYIVYLFGDKILFLICN